MFSENLCQGERCEELVDLMGLINKSELQKENAELQDKLNNLTSVAEVRLANWQKFEKENAAQIEKTKCLNEEIIKSLRETLDYEWLPAHNGKAKYLYLQTVIDIVNEKFEEIKEK